MTKQNQQDEFLFNQKCNKLFFFLRVYSNHRSKVHVTAKSRQKKTIIQQTVIWTDTRHLITNLQFWVNNLLMVSY